eukprot:COSAG01_NODE_3587_length_5905_cov_36.428522_2_plen_104_part_00
MLPSPPPFLTSCDSPCAEELLLLKEALRKIGRLRGRREQNSQLTPADSSQRYLPASVLCCLEVLIGHLRGDDVHVITLPRVQERPDLRYRAGAQYTHPQYTCI